MKSIVPENVMNRVMAEINETELLETTKELIEIRSENPPGSYEKITEYVERKWRDIGLKTRVVDVPDGEVKKCGLETGRINIIGILGDNSESGLILDGHTDTVSAGVGWTVNPFEATVRNSRVYGRGATDMKGGLSAMTVAAESLIRADIGLESNLILTATVDDEIASPLGIKYLLDHDLVKARNAVCCEGTSSLPGTVDINTCFGGRLWVRITTKGKSAHGAKPQEGINAITKMMNLSERIQSIALPSHRIYGNSTVNLGMISGGLRPNIVPDACTATFDFRFGPPTLTDQVIEKINSTVAKMREDDREFVSREIEVSERRDPFEMPENHEFVSTLSRTIERITGAFPRLTPALGSGNAYHLWKAGIPAVFCGPGDPALFHKSDESVSLTSILNCARIYSSLTLILCGNRLD